jgi:polygalacturonase
MAFFCHLSILLSLMHAATVPAPASWGSFSTATYEAEAAEHLTRSVIENNEKPFIGTGYVRMEGPGSSIEWTSITVKDAGVYSLLIKYANGSGSDIACDLSVNGVGNRRITFPKGMTPREDRAWSYYWVARTSVRLNAGKNVIRLTCTSAVGPVIDNLSVSAGLPAAPPLPTFDVTNYGARANNPQFDNTGAIQKAIDACTPGASVVIKGGTYMTGGLTLKPDMTFWIDESATVKAIRDIRLFPSVPASNTSNATVRRAFIHCPHADNLTITGGGTIDDNGADSLWSNSKFTPVASTPDSPWDPAHIPEGGRPSPVWLENGRNVIIRNIDIVHSVMWSLVPDQCDQVIIDGVNIDCRSVNGAMPNETVDGIDPCDCHDVSITNCSLLTGDDIICPKSHSSKGVIGLTARNITGNSTNDNFIKFGTASYQCFKNMVFEDMAGRGSRVRPTHGGLTGISLGIVDGGDVDNIAFNRIQLDNFGCPIFILNGGGRRGHSPAGFPKRDEENAGAVGNITISNLIARDMSDSIGAIIMGTEGTRVNEVRNITLRNVDIEFKGGMKHVPQPPAEYRGAYPESNRFRVPAWGFFIRHASDIQFIDCKLTVFPSDARNPFVEIDARHVVHAP